MLVLTPPRVETPLRGVVYKGRDEVFSIYILLGGNQVLLGNN